MPEDFVGIMQMRRGDRLPMLSVRIEDDDGVALNLTGATSVRFHFRDEDGGYPVTGFPPGEPGDWLVQPAMIVDRVNGIVAYDWDRALGDLVPGTLQLVVVVEYPDDTVSAPSDRTARILVRDDAT